MNSNDVKKELKKVVEPIVIDVIERTDDQVYHLHMCDFELIYRNSKTIKNKCKQYLKSIGKRRDRYMMCCDMCKHMKYLQCAEDDQDDIVAILSPTEEEIEMMKMRLKNFKW